MTEIISAVSNVAGLFNTAVSFFEYVRVAKQTANRLQFLILQLDNAQVRLTRWGAAAGVSGGRIRNEESAYLTLDEKQKEVAVQTFNHILDAFEDIEKRIQKIQKTSGSQAKDDSIPVSEALREVEHIYLHNSMQAIVDERRNKIPPLRKFKFAIYDEKHLRELVENINKLIDTLYETFPLKEGDDASIQQSQLCKVEMDRFLGVLEILNTAVGRRDQLLQSAIEVILNQKNNMRMNFQNKQANIGMQGLIEHSRADMSIDQSTKP